MKFTTTLAAFFLPAVLALPSIDNSALKRSDEDIVDQYVFDLTLAQFLAKRAAEDPATLDWSSDNCSFSPDNPAGYPFEPGCQRHDFGYRNFKAQDRFTDENKLAIDDNFKADLYNQCAGQPVESACKALANVYYAAVRLFGRSASAEFSEGLAAYDEAVAAYNAEVAKAKKRGLL